jgi:ferrous iron transport protein B
MPTAGSILRDMWDRSWSFIKRAGTLILLGAVVIWFASDFGWRDGVFGLVDADDSILAAFGGAVAWLFRPLGWGDWQSTVAAITGIIAKENIVGTFGVLFGSAGVADASGAADGSAMWERLSMYFTPLSAYSFLLFNLLCAPCIAAIATIRREMDSARWFWFAIGYQCGFAYVTALCVYQFGIMFSGRFGVGSIFAFLFLLLFLHMLLRKQRDPGKALREGGDLGRAKHGHHPQPKHTRGAADPAHEGRSHGKHGGCGSCGNRWYCGGGGDGDGEEGS